MIHLSACSDHGRSGEYIARITGRDKTYIFQREFIGQRIKEHHTTTIAIVDTPGLFEICHSSVNEGRYRFYLMVLETESRLIQFGIHQKIAKEIATRMGRGEDLSSFVVAHEADPESADLLKYYKYLIRNRITGSDPLDMFSERTVTMTVGRFRPGQLITHKELQLEILSELHRLEHLFDEMKKSGRYLEDGYRILRGTDHS